jgi:cell division septation protein DedD
MKTRFEEDEDLAEPMHDSHDREITLGSMTLLAIFFGLVLLCGLFFGMGYTLGRRSPAAVNAKAGDEGAATAQMTDSKPKPSASAQVAVPQPVVDETPAPDPQPEAASTSEAETVKPQVQEAVLQTSTVKPAMATTAADATTAPNGIMVQIAAISNPADADVLVGALRKHGYTVTTRHESSDALLHVQVGPFATRAEANAMRQKLLADGYNAILK